MVGHAIGFQVFALLPIPLGIALYLFAPAYSLPMLRSGIGIAMLVATIGLVGAGLSISSIAAAMVRSGRVVLGFLVEAASLLLLSFPATWLVILGPALVVLLEPK